MIARRALPLLVLAAGAARAQPGFPMRPPRFIVPFTPGGAPDLVARMLAEESGRRWPHAIVVESRPGAGGNIAAEAVARATPDGHTLLLMSNNIVAVNPHIGRMSFAPLTDLVPVALLARSPLVLVVGADSPVRDIQGLVAAARAQPRRLAYASAGNGSPHHLAMALLCQRAGVEMTHVPYRGTIPGLTDLVAGRVAAMASPFGTALPLIAEGRLRPIAAAAITRLPWLPDLPTVAESGLPGFDANTWLALAAPRGTPATLVSSLAGFAMDTMESPRVWDALDRGGNQAEAGSPAVLGALWRANHEEWGGANHRGIKRPLRCAWETAMKRGGRLRSPRRSISILFVVLAPHETDVSEAFANEGLKAGRTGSDPEFFPLAAGGFHRGKPARHPAAATPGFPIRATKTHCDRAAGIAPRAAGGGRRSGGTRDQGVELQAKLRGLAAELLDQCLARLVLLLGTLGFRRLDQRGQFLRAHGVEIKTGFAPGCSLGCFGHSSLLGEMLARGKVPNRQNRSGPQPRAEHGYI